MTQPPTTSPVTEIFVDGIRFVTANDGVVRIDFVSLSPYRRGDDNRPAVENSVRLIMPLKGFTASMDTLRRFVEGVTAGDKTTSG